MSNPSRSRRHGAAEIAVLSAATLWLLGLSNRGINPVDEGMQLLRSYEIHRGLITYRDVYSPIAPLSYFIHAALMDLFGVQLIVGRFWAALEGLAAVAIALHVSRRALRPPFHLAPAALLIPFGPALSGFPHYNSTALIFFLGSVAVLVGGLDRPSVGRVFAAAVLAGLAAITKQSLIGPAAALLVLGLYLARTKSPAGLPRPASQLLAAAAGFALPILLLATYYAAHSGLQEIARDLFSALGMKRAVLLSLLPRAGMIFTAGFAPVAAGVWLGRKRPGLWPALGLAALAAGVGLAVALPVELAGPAVCGLTAVSLLVFVRPGPDDPAAAWWLLRGFGALTLVNALMSGADLGHLLMGATGAVFSAGLLLQRAFAVSAIKKSRAERKLAIAGLALVIIAGLWLDLTVPHLSYAMPSRLRATSPILQPGFTGVRTAPEQAAALGGVVGWLRDRTDPDEKIFVYPWSQLIYVMAERLPAARDTFLYFEMFDGNVLHRLLSDLDRNRPRVIVVEMEGDRPRQVALSSSARAFEQWLRSRYVEAERFGDYEIMLRNDAPAPEAATNQER